MKTRNMKDIEREMDMEMSKMEYDSSNPYEWTHTVIIRTSYHVNMLC